MGQRMRLEEIIDDTLSVWASKDRFLEFFQYLNTLQDNVKWTCKTETNNKLAIFDLLIIRTESGYKTAGYREINSFR